MIQVRAQAGGGKLRAIDSKVVDRAKAMWEVVTRGAGAGLAWPALLRKLDRIDTSYRE